MAQDTNQPHSKPTSGFQLETRPTMHDPVQMRRVLPIMTAAATLALAAFMIIMGYIAWWLAPIVIAWNVGPLVIACWIPAKAYRPSWLWISVLFASAYIAFACLEYYDVFFREQSKMARFAYLFVPVPGWFGLVIAKLLDAFVTFRSEMLR